MDGKIKYGLTSVTILLLAALFLLGSLEAGQNNETPQKTNNTTNISANKKIAIILPHPDDETIGMGGTIPMLKDNGNQVHCVLMTSGNAISSDLRIVNNYYNVTIPENASKTEKKKLIREDSFRRVMDLYGCDYETKGIDDGDLSNETAFQTMEKLYLNGNYTEFYTVTGDGNNDHLACYQAMKMMMEKYPELKYREFPIYYYHANHKNPKTLTDNFTDVDVSNFIVKKQEAFQIYYNINTIIPEFYPYSTGYYQASPERIFYIN
jgi:LmbE family N-acetylglucosaminyl deacetylase